MTIVSVLFIPQAKAQEMIVEADNLIIGQLQSNCDEIRTTLRRIHTNDALTRVNIGQFYASTSTQFMARLNSRLALNSISSTELVDITGRFDNQRSELSYTYKEYEASLSSLIKIDCKERPAEFYALLLATRDARSRVAEVTSAANGLMADYQVGVESMQQGLRGDVVEEGVVDED